MSRQPSPDTRSRPTPIGIVIRLAAFWLLWWALAEGDLYNWWFGVIMVAVATVASLVMQPVTQVRILGILRFVPFFVRQSVMGGIDVAMRAFSPKMPLNPGFVEVRLRLPNGPARVFLANTMSLLPGTVCAELMESSIRLHVLDLSMPIEETARAGEKRVADMFGIDL